MATISSDKVVMPTTNERDQIRTIGEALRRCRDGKPGDLHLVLEVNGENVDLLIPPVLQRLIEEIADAMDTSESVAIVPLDEDLTTTQAADMLDVSRQYLQRLLDQGAIPYHMVGTHHRVKARDIVAFRQTRENLRDRALTEILQVGQDLQHDE